MKYGFVFAFLTLTLVGFSQEKPTVCIIMMDDWNRNDMYAFDQFRLQEIASQSLVLPNAISAVVCGQAGIQLHFDGWECQGLQSSNTSIRGNEAWIRSVMPLSTGQRFKEAGYFTAKIGKNRIASQTAYNRFMLPANFFDWSCGFLTHSNLEYLELEKNKVFGGRRVGIRLDNNINGKPLHTDGHRDSVNLFSFLNSAFQKLKQKPVPSLIIFETQTPHGPFRKWTDLSRDVDYIGDSTELWHDADTDYWVSKGMYLADSINNEELLNRHFRAGANRKLDRYIGYLIDSLESIYGDNLIVAIGSDNGASSRLGGILQPISGHPKENMMETYSYEKSYHATGGWNCQWMIYAPGRLAPRVDYKPYNIGDIRNTLLAQAGGYYFESDSTGWNVWNNWAQDTANTRRKYFMVGGYNFDVENDPENVTDANRNASTCIFPDSTCMVINLGYKFGQQTKPAPPTFQLFNWISDKGFLNPIVSGVDFATKKALLSQYENELCRKEMPDIPPLRGDLPVSFYLDVFRQNKILVGKGIWD